MDDCHLPLPNSKCADFCPNSEAGPVNWGSERSRTVSEKHGVPYRVFTAILRARFPMRIDGGMAVYQYEDTAIVATVQ